MKKKVCRLRLSGSGRWSSRTTRELSVRRQCELLGLNRSSLYYEPAAETAENLRLMRLIDEEYTGTRSTAAGG